MKKLLLASAMMPLLSINPPANAGTVTVNVPLSVKSMREEIAYVKVWCHLGYEWNNQMTYQQEQSEILPLDNFGNLKQTVSIQFNTGTLPPEVLHGPQRYIACKALFTDSNNQSIVLSETVPADPAARSALINEQSSNFTVLAEQWVPDAPSPMLRMLSGENDTSSTPTLNRPNNLRIR